MLFDTHAHLEIIDDLEGSIKRAKEAGVEKIITIGTSLESSKKAVEIAEKFSDDDLQIYATCGLHPKDAKSELKRLHYNDILKSLKSLALSSEKVVGLGECGLDYYPDTADKDKNFQKELFETQINLAADLNLPLIIHCRNGWDEIFDLMEAKRGPSSLSSVFHSFTGNWQAAQKALDLGFYISFSGIVTFKNAKEIQEVAKKMPLERLLIETDSPFLTPEPIRSGPPKLTSRLSSTIRTRLEERNRRGYKQNEPKNVRIIAEFLANLRSQPIDKIIGASADNAKRLFGI